MTQPTEYENLAYNAPDGCLVGQLAADKVAFHGATPVVQAAFVAQLSTSAGITAAVGFTGTQAAALLAAVNSILTALINKGFMAAS